MIKGLSYIWGLDFINNRTAKKVLRIALNVAAAVAATTPAGGPLLAVLGITPSPTAGAIVGAALTLAEAVRNEVKHSENPSK